MKRTFFSFIIITVLASLISCHTAKESTTGSASIVGKNWKVVELDGQTLQPAQDLRRAPHLILNDAEKRVTGNGGCNSFFGSYEFQGNNGITFSKIGSTKMACPNDAMQVEGQLFQAFEMTRNFTVRNDTLFLRKADMSILAKFVVSEMK